MYFCRSHLIWNPTYKYYMVQDSRENTHIALPSVTYNLIDGLQISLPGIENLIFPAERGELFLASFAQSGPLLSCARARSNYAWCCNIICQPANLQLDAQTLNSRPPTERVRDRKETMQVRACLIPTTPSLMQQAENWSGLRLVTNMTAYKTCSTTEVTQLKVAALPLNDGGAQAANTGKGKTNALYPYMYSTLIDYGRSCSPVLQMFWHLTLTLTTSYFFYYYYFFKNNDNSILLIVLNCNYNT